MSESAFLVGLTIILVGFVGIFIPVMPGVPLMWLGAVIYSALTSWDVLTWPWLVLLTLVTVACFCFDYVASAWIARKLGSSHWGAAGVIAGTVLGIVFFGAFGALLGGVTGAVAVEMGVRRSWRMALRAGTGALLGFLVALAADTLAGLIVLSVFLWRAL
ncbi:MAG: DUF456 family protein [Chloroflexota bacterium]|nr:DUF456 family protein [Chloroflexota bacterium]